MRHDRVGEEQDDEQVDQGREAEGEREAAHVGDGQQVEHDGGEEVDAVGGQDGAPGPPPAGVDRGTQRPALADLVTDAFEVDDERVGGDTDGHDQTGDAGHVEPEVVRPAQQRDHDVGEHRRR